MPGRSNDHRDEPVYWFVILAKALNDGQLVEAGHAQRELERLGFTVRYRRTKKSADTSEGGSK